MKKCLKIFFIILIYLCCNISFTYASDIDIMGTARNWINLGKKEQGSTNLAKTKTEFNDLAGVLWELGIFVVVICGTIVGIKYMFASVEEKASIKESIQPYLIGSVIILGALGIWKFLVEFLEGVL